jgi:hypothetical protein
LVSVHLVDGILSFFVFFVFIRRLTPRPLSSFTSFPSESSSTLKTSHLGAKKRLTNNFATETDTLALEETSTRRNIRSGGREEEESVRRIGGVARVFVPHNFEFCERKRMRNLIERNTFASENQRSLSDATEKSFLVAYTRCCRRKKTSLQKRKSWW